MIEYWCPTPIGYYDIDQQEFVEVINEINSNIFKIENVLEDNSCKDYATATFKTCSNILFELELNKTFSVINKYTMEFIQQTSKNLCPKDDYTPTNFCIVGSWFNYLHPLGFQMLHTHGSRKSRRFFCSGVFFYDSTFKDNEDPEKKSLLEFDLSSNESFYNTPRGITYEYTPGRIILFPSNVPHRVRFNQTSQIRKSISFNVEIIEN